MRICGNDFHTDHAFGRIIADLDVLFIELVRFLVGRVVVQALDRVNVACPKMRLEARIIVEAQHRILGLQIGLCRDTVSRVGKLRRQHAGKRA